MYFFLFFFALHKVNVHLVKNSDLLEICLTPDARKFAFVKKFSSCRKYNWTRVII